MGLSSTSLPATPCLATPELKDFRITPDMLCFFSSKVDEIVMCIHGVKSAYYQMNVQSKLQHEELHQQEAKTNKICALLGELHGTWQDCIDACMSMIQVGQQVLLTWLDCVLTELIMHANLILSNHKMKWFDKLGRMHEQVLGAGKYNKVSLKAW